MQVGMRLKRPGYSRLKSYCVDSPKGVLMCAVVERPLIRLLQMLFEGKKAIVVANF